MWCGEHNYSCMHAWIVIYLLRAIELTKSVYFLRLPEMLHAWQQEAPGVVREPDPFPRGYAYRSEPSEFFLDAYNLPQPVGKVWFTKNFPSLFTF